MIRWLCLAILTFFGSCALAQEEAPSYLPVEWQRVELQSKITADLERSISAVIDRDKFLIQVSVSISAAKTFGAKNKNENASVGLDKLGITNNSKAYQRAISSSNDTVFERIQSITVDLMVDNSVSAAQQGQAQKFVATIVASYSDAKPLVRASRMQFLPSSNDSKSHKQNLEVANVQIEAANKLAEAIKNSNTQLSESINAMSAALTGKEYKQETKTVKEERQLPKDWQAIILEFKMEIGILLATLLILIFFSGFKSIEGQKVALMAQANRQAKEATDVAVQSGSGGGGIETAGANAAAAASVDAVANSVAVSETKSSNDGNGFVQFTTLAQLQPQIAAYFVKIWINIGTQEANEAVAILPKRLPLEVLAGIYSEFSAEMKDKLRKVSLTPLNDGSASRADNFIVQQLVNNFLVSTVELPEELKALTSSMTLNECLECMGQDSKICGIFMNILQVEQVGRVLLLIPEDSVNEYLENGLKYAPEDNAYLEQKLPGLLAGLRKDSGGYKAPLLSKSQELIKLLGPSREKEIFEMLGSSGNTQQLMEAARTYFPSELLLQLSPELLRAIINQLQPTQRAELIFSRPVTEQAVILKAVGDTGRMREMLDLELKQITSSEKKKSQVEKNQDKIWNQFVFRARDSINSNPLLKDAAEILLKKWLEDKGVTENVDSAA